MGADEEIDGTEIVKFLPNAQAPFFLTDPGFVREDTMSSRMNILPSVLYSWGWPCAAVWPK